MFIRLFETEEPFVVGNRKSAAPPVKGDAAEKVVDLKVVQSFPLHYWGLFWKNPMKLSKSAIIFSNFGFVRCTMIAA